MAQHSPQYLEHAWSIDGKSWRGSHPYVEGVRVTWSGVRLVCTFGHYAGHVAVHPWDPGYGWDERKAATLWTPDGEVEVARLRALVQDIAGGLLGPNPDGRLLAILTFAAGLAP